MSRYDKHPWTPVRWLTEDLYIHMKEDWPEADNDYLFEESSAKCEEAWTNEMTDRQKRRYFKLSRKDEKKCIKEAKDKEEINSLGKDEKESNKDAEVSSKTSKVKQEVNSSHTVQSKKKRPSEGQPAVDAKKNKKIRDPMLPKKPLTSYFVFASSKKEGIKAANPDFSILDVSKELGGMWKAMSTEEKAPYLAEAEKLKKKYAADMAEYNKNLKEKND